jgi:hypothetical protein
MMAKEAHILQLRRWLMQEETAEHVMKAAEP